MALASKKLLEAVKGTAAITAAAAATTVLVSELSRKKPNLSAFGDSLYFPLELGSEKYPYYISFSFREYQRRSIYDRVFLRDLGMIRMPIPNELIDASSLTYSTPSSGLLAGAITETILNQSKTVSDWSQRSFSRAAQEAMSIPSYIAAAAAAAGGAASLSVSKNLMSIAGVAHNPFLTVLFESPNYKQHHFTWTLNPSNEKESEILRAIINKFKYHMLPDTIPNTAGTLLTYPDIVLVGLYPASKYLYDFKPCIVRSFSINYTSEGQPAFFGKTDAPVTAIISLDLMEIEYWLKDDILEPKYDR